MIDKQFRNSWYLQSLIDRHILLCGANLPLGVVMLNNETSQN
jgi:hypothetical protein